MTIYYTKYGGIIHNPEAYFKLGGEIYYSKDGAFKLKKYKKEISKPKNNKYVIDMANLFELGEYKKDLNLGYSYYNTRIRQYKYLHHIKHVLDL